MTPQRYAASAIVLHWTIALLLAFQLGLGWHMTSMPRGGTMFAAFQFHKSVGIAILILSLARLAVRVFKPRPAPPAGGVLARTLAKAVHGGLYLVMIGAPLTGWALVSTARIAVPTRLFGVVPLPNLPLGERWHELAENNHGLLAWLAVILITLHLAGALRHHLLRPAGEHENVLARMIPLPERVASEAVRVGSVALALAVLAFAFVIPWLAWAGAKAGDDDRALLTPAAAKPTTAGLAIAAQPAATGHPAPPAAASQVPDRAWVWQVGPGGRLGFTAQLNDSAVEGRFTRWSADIVFDPDDLPGSQIVVRVPLASATTDSADRDGTLHGPDFFGNAAGSAVFRSTGIRHVAGERYAAVGTLAMNGKVRPIRLVFNLAIRGDRAVVSGSTRLDRTAFGIGTGDWAATDQIAAAVDVSFSFSASRKG